jgi:hypothetical protein
MSAFHEAIYMPTRQGAVLMIFLKEIDTQHSGQYDSTMNHKGVAIKKSAHYPLSPVS